MADRTGIEWCDSTFNPWIGCTKVSPGCDHCYAARQDTFRRWTPEGWGGPRRRTSVALWKQVEKWNDKRFMECAACGWRGECAAEVIGCGACGSIDHLADTRRRVFCASLSDVFDNQVPTEWRADLFQLIAVTPHLDWLLLTKRVGNAHAMIGSALQSLYWEDEVGEAAPMPPWPWPNVWLGATVVNQAEVDRDVPKLLATPARVRFLSVEPMLGPVDLERPRPGPDLDQGGGRMICQPWLIQSGIDWVICGGESGTGARPMHRDWARSLRDQCAAAGVPFMFKQHGMWCTSADMLDQTGDSIYTDDLSRLRVAATAMGIDGRMSHDANLVGERPETLYRIGKKAAGRTLDGREHNDFPGGAS